MPQGRLDLTYCPGDYPYALDRRKTFTNADNLGGKLFRVVAHFNPAPRQQLTRPPRRRSRRPTLSQVSPKLLSFAPSNFSPDNLGAAAIPPMR
jgi:hypothetical protein